MFKGFKPRQDLTGFTAIPNEWFDEVMARIDNLAELKIVQAVFRKTYGWVESWQENTAIYKLEDEISYSQFEEMTGLSSASISEGIKKAIAHGYIIQVKAGNFVTGQSGSYRIRMVDDAPQTLEERPQLRGVSKFLPTSSSKVEGDLPTSSSKAGDTSSSKVDTTSSSKPSITSSSKVTIESNKKGKKEKERDFEIPKNEEREVYSTKDVRTRGITQYEKYKNKDVLEYNANDLAYYFSDSYERITGVRYGKITNKERRHMKELLDTNGAEVVVKGIDYLMREYRTLIDGYPSIAVLFGFRTSIIPSAVKGTPSSKLDVRETRLTEEDIQREKANDNVIEW